MVAVKAILSGEAHARSAITAETDSTNTHTASRAAAAEPAARSRGEKVRILRCRRKQEP